MPVKQIRLVVGKEKYDQLKAKKGDRTWVEAVCEEFGVETEDA